jgi:hypothetical protein
VLGYVSILEKDLGIIGKFNLSQRRIVGYDFADI